MRNSFRISVASEEYQRLSCQWSTLLIPLKFSIRVYIAFYKYLPLYSWRLSEVMHAWSLELFASPRSHVTLRDFELPQDWSNWGALSTAANLESIHEAVLSDPQKKAVKSKMCKNRPSTRKKKQQQKNTLLRQLRSVKEQDFRPLQCWNMLEVSEDYKSGLSKDGEQMEKKVRSAALR